MAQSSANWEDPDFDGGDPETNSASNADDTSGSPASAIAQSDRSDPSDPSDPSDESDRSDQSDQSDQPDAPPRPQSALAPQNATPAQPPAPAAARQRQPVKQIGQIPILDSSWMLEPFPGPFSQAPDPHAAWMQKAQRSQTQWAQIARINQGSPYISVDDGRWKKQSVDSRTGAVNESDVLDAGLGKINRTTGDISLQTAFGPRVIGVDPQQKLLTQIVARKAQAQSQGSPLDANLAAAKSAFLDTQDQLQDFQGIPERMSAQIAKYTQVPLDPNDPAAAARLQRAQGDITHWKLQNPSYTSLIARRDALANQIQTLTAAKTQNDLQVAQLLTTPQYVQWTSNTPPAIGGASPAAPSDGSAPPSDISIHDLDARAGVIAAQTGFPAGFAYASAIRQARQQGAQTVDGDSIDDALNSLQPVAQAQLPAMPPPLMRKAFQAGLITRRQAKATAMAQRAARDQAQAAAPADDSSDAAGPVEQSIADLNARAADLRNKIQSAFDTGGADGARDLATCRAALADTESQLHDATQTLVNRVPAVLQQRIVKAVAPDLDWDSVTQKNAHDPIAHFATENLGSALRDQDISPGLQQRIRQLAISRSFNPDVADHIANQAVGANAVRTLTGVLRGRGIDEARANTLQAMGFLQQRDPDDPSSPLHLTEDAQRLLPPGGQRRVQITPERVRYTPSADPAHGSALYQNAVAGMQRFSDTAERTLPAQDFAPANGSATPSDTSDGSLPTDANGSANTAATATTPAKGNSESAATPAQQQDSTPHRALANTPQQALQDAANGKKAYLFDQKNGIQFKPEALADGLKQAVQDGVVDKDWAAQHQQEFQDAQDKYQALQKAAGSAQVLKALIHGAGPGAAFAAAFPLGATGGAAAGAPIGGWVGGILGAPTGPGEVATIPAGTATGAGIGYLLGGLGAGTLAAFGARKGLQALGQYSDAIKSLNASAELHPIADATGELATLALNPVGAGEKAAGEGFSYAVGSPAAVKSISNLTKLGAQAAKGATEIGTSGTVAATKAVGGQLAKAAAAGLIFEGAVRPAFEGAVWVAANTLGIHTDAPQPPTVTSLLQSAALSVLLAGHGLEFKDIPASQVTSAMVRGKVRADLSIPLDSADPQHIAQVTSYMQSKGVPIDASNAQALTAPLTAAEQHLYTDLSAKIDAMKAAGKFDGKTGDFVPATQVTVPG